MFLLILEEENLDIYQIRKIPRKQILNFKPNKKITLILKTVSVILLILEDRYVFLKNEHFGESILLHY